MKRTGIWIVLAGMLACTARAESLNYADLVGRLTDMERLAVLPEAGEKCSQWSSWDRASQFDAATGNYVKWDANGDNDGIIRKEDGKQVLAEMEGPGVIWRIWSAKDGPGHVRVFLDGNSEPAVDLPFTGYFDCKNEPFVYPALVHKVAMGLNNYVPIPYQKSCKIVADPDWGAYYHFTYTTYPKGTVLPTFKLPLSEADTEALAKANEILSNCGRNPAGRRPGEARIIQDVKVAPGETATVVELHGPRAITSIRVRMEVPEAPASYDVMRSLVLSMNWDGQATPSVWTPLGDFFGTAPGVNEYQSLPLGMNQNGFYSFWYMPFRKAVIRLTNDGTETRTVRFAITHAGLSRPIEQLGRFGVKWHRDARLDDRRPIDWTLLKTDGRGRYCGVMLHVWNPRGGWWGEGDEKFFVDGETFPSTFGTGSEDYFGYAWCNPTLFQNCYHNQTISNNNKGHVSVNRWHITDNIPFQKSFDGSIEKYYPNSRPTLYASTVYFYLAAGQDDGYAPIPMADRAGYWQPVELPLVKGAIEGEKLKVIKKTAGNPHEQDMAGFGGENWSGEAHLWWIDAKPGDTLELAVPVKEAGTYTLKANFTKAVDYGIVQLYLDGKKLGEPMDFYNDGVVPTGAMILGTRELTAGEHVFKAEIVGANDKAVKSYMFGLDYLLLEKK
ncbi:MAG: DUF2961 domain-containing protein [Phycisphaerae bacterium]|nr:DUF2961 domain-containing protein [Phycisphaerae bacterium]